MDEGQIEVARFLVFDIKADMNYHRREPNWMPILVRAIWRRQEAMALWLLRETHADREATNMDGQTPIMMAAFKGLVEVVRVLALEVGVSLESKEEDGLDVMYWAVVGGSAAVVSFLMDHERLSMDQAYKYQGQLLHIASDHGHLELAQWLILRGADPTETSCRLVTTHEYNRDRGI